MSEKLINFKKEIISNNNDIHLLIDNKIDFYKDVIQRTVIHAQKNKILDILGINDVSTCIEKLGLISKKIMEIIDNKNIDSEILIHNLQLINNDLSLLLKNYHS